MRGFIPASAAPMAAAVVAFSETGESMTRSLPNSFSMSWRLVPAYQGLHTPCPMTKTRGSLASNCAKPSRIACTYVSVRMSMTSSEKKHGQAAHQRVDRLSRSRIEWHLQFPGALGFQFPPTLFIEGLAHPH